MSPDLKSLKVADLKRILAAANLTAPARATKADLITRILDNQQAINTYHSLYDPPKQQDPLPNPTTPPSPPPPPPQQQPDKPLSPQEIELEKRKARAARFGIPLIDPPPDDQEKLKARARRFGIDPPTDDKQPSAPVDAEELEKRKKRAERFGTKAPDASS